MIVLLMLYGYPPYGRPWNFNTRQSYGRASNFSTPQLPPHSCIDLLDDCRNIDDLQFL